MEINAQNTAFGNPPFALHRIAWSYRSMQSLRVALASASTLSIALAVGCATSSNDDGGNPGGASTAGDASGFRDDGGATLGEVDGSTGGANCDPPDVLLLLDRTLTMHRTPSGGVPDAGRLEDAKFWQAVEAIEQLVAPPTDTSVRFGLALWPRDPGLNDAGAESCLTLAERVTNARQTSNASCEPPEIRVPTGPSAGAAIQASLDPQTTRLCFSTPTGGALQGAIAELARVRAPGRRQHIVLVTDGADWDLTCPTPDPRAVVAEAATQGITTFVVGFDAQGDAGATSGVGLGFLNDMACAGKTAKGFSTACTADADAGGAYRAIDRNAPPLFLLATNGQELARALKDAVTSVCCNCAR
jgi:hypothetical protein